MGAFAILRFMSGRVIPFLALLAALINAAAARADEIRLKDGTKISGTIVRFHSGSGSGQTRRITRREGTSCSNEYSRRDGCVGDRTACGCGKCSSHPREK